MDALIAQVLEFVQNLTAYLGEFEASGIIAMVKNLLGNIDLSAVTGLLTQILAIFGQAA